MSAGSPLLHYPQVACPHCFKALPDGAASEGDMICPNCGRSFRMLLFSPPQRRAQAVSQAGLTPGSAAVCGNHPRNAAAYDCSRCGMFICSLCAVEADAMILCPACYDRLTAEGALASTRTKFRDLGGLAATSAGLGILVWPLSFITGPLAIWYGVRAFRQRRELGEVDSRWRIWLAMFVGLIETAAWVVLLIAVVGAFGK